MTSGDSYYKDRINPDPSPDAADDHVLADEKYWKDHYKGIL